MKKNNSGITLLALIIMIIVLIIIASIAVYEGKELIEKSKVQTVETCMLTIQAKAKAYAEEIESKIWTESDSTKGAARDSKFSEKGFTVVNLGTNDYSGIIDQIDAEVKENGYTAYKVGASVLENLSLDYAEGEEFIVVYDNKEFKKIDVAYVKGSKGLKYNGENYFTLSKLQKALEE